MKRYTIALMLVFLMAGLGSTTATAKFNVGASLTDTTTEGGSFDADDNNWKIFAGWRLSNLKWLAIEAQYVDFGEFNDNVAGSNIRAESSSFGVFGKASIAVWRFDLFGKAGLARWDSQVSNVSDDDGTDFAYGVGAAFRITGKIWVRAEWEVFDVDVFDQDMTSLGIDIRF